MHARVIRTFHCYMFIYIYILIKLSGKGGKSFYITPIRVRHRSITVIQRGPFGYRAIARMPISAVCHCRPQYTPPHKKPTTLNAKNKLFIKAAKLSPMISDILVPYLGGSPSLQPERHDWARFPF